MENSIYQYYLPGKEYIPSYNSTMEEKRQEISNVKKEKFIILVFSNHLKLGFQIGHGESLVYIHSMKTVPLFIGTHLQLRPTKIFQMLLLKINSNKIQLWGFKK